MIRIAKMLAMLLFLCATVPCALGQFDEEDETPPTGDPGDTSIEAEVLRDCLLPTNVQSCQGKFQGGGTSGSCSGAVCTASSSCSPSSVTRYNPKWSEPTGWEYRSAYVGENGFKLKPKAVNCKVDQPCGCGWSNDAQDYICQLTTGWTVLQAYQSAKGPSQGGCEGMAPQP
jgi:hypothetical protein